MKEYKFLPSLDVSILKNREADINLLKEKRILQDSKSLFLVSKMNPQGHKCPTNINFNELSNYAQILIQTRTRVNGTSHYHSGGWRMC